MKTKQIVCIFLFILISCFMYSQDSLKLKPIYIKALPDSIFINKNNKIEYRGILLTRGEARRLMKTKPNVRTEIRMTNLFRAFSTITFIEGGIQFVSFAIDASKGNFDWVGGGLGFVDLVVFVVMQQQVNKHFDKAIKLYNTKPAIAGVRNFKPELGVASKGLGVCLQF